MLYLKKVLQLLNDQYADFSYIIQKKVSILLAVLVVYIMSAATGILFIFFVLEFTNDLISIFIINCGLIIFSVLGVYYLFKGKYHKVVIPIILYSTFYISVGSFARLETTIHSGTNDFAFFGFCVISLAAFFGSKRLLLVITLYFFIFNIFFHLLAMFSPERVISVQPFIATMLNLSLATIIVSVFSNLISEITYKALLITEEKLSENMELNLTLEKKVEQRTLELEREVAEKEKIQKQMFQSSKLASIGELASGLAHEINNPLLISLGNLDIVKEYVTEGKGSVNEVNKALDLQNDSLIRITKIIDILRNYSKIDSKNESFFDIKTTIEESILLIRSEYSKAGIKFIIEYKGADSYVNGVKSRFQHVIMNILLNCRDALQNVSEPCIWVNTLNQNDNVIIQIRDNGAGIEQENLDKIFDSFFTTKDIGKGTGLGLSFAYEVINSMQGTIEVFSEYQKWTEVVIKLPVAVSYIKELI